MSEEGDTFVFRPVRRSAAREEIFERDGDGHTRGRARKPDYRTQSKLYRIGKVTAMTAKWRRLVGVFAGGEDGGQVWVSGTTATNSRCLPS